MMYPAPAENENNLSLPSSAGDMQQELRFPSPSAQASQ